MIVAEPTVNPELVFAHLDRLPPLPAIAIQLIELTTRSDASLADVIALLRGDQALSAKVLSLANSAATGLRQPATTLERAIPMIGLTAVRSVVLASVVFDCFPLPPRKPTAGGFDRAEFWKHSIAVACGARRLAAAKPDTRVDAEEAYIAGLLHDLGKVALHAIFPKGYDRVVLQAAETHSDIADVERAILGADHTVVGRRLADRWRLPRMLQESIWLHHLAADSLPASAANARLIAAVQLADVVAREQRIGMSGNHAHYESSARLADRLGFRPADMSAVVENLLADVAAQCEFLGLERPLPEAMYAHAMSQANADLARINHEMLDTNRRLAASARYFHAISEFDRNLIDWSDPPAVVEAIAKAAQIALQRQEIMAFGLRDNWAAVDISQTQTPAASRVTRAAAFELVNALHELNGSTELIVKAPAAVRSLLASNESAAGTSNIWWLLPIAHEGQIRAGIVFASDAEERAKLASETDDLRSFLVSVGLALGRANAHAAARKLSEDLAETNRRLQQVQVELLRSRTLSMIAEMAAGAGHELNSPLTVISGRAQMLASQITDPEARRSLEVIMRKAHECSGIVSELMDFARPHAPELEPVDLAALIAEVRDEVVEKAKLPPSRIAIDVSAPSGTQQPPPANADRQQIRTVLIELLNNAIDAVYGNDGIITIKCRRSTQGDGVELIIRDTGIGMTPQVLQSAFDPFFSHRQAGRGRGLGLPRAYRIVELHHGRITLESRRDEGTTVRVLLPIATRTA